MIEKYKLQMSIRKILISSISEFEMPRIWGKTFQNNWWNMERLIIPLIFGLVLIFNTDISAQVNSVLFRFNTNHDSSGTISSAVEISNVEYQTNIDSVESEARSTIGWDYYASIYSVFSGDSSYLKSKEKVELTFLGNHKLSGEVWFQTDNLNASIFSWNDSTQVHGIDLYLSDGKLNLERRFNDTTIVLRSNSDIELQKWYHFIWTMDVSGSDVLLEFYINNYLDISQILILNSDVESAVVNSFAYVGKSTYKTELQNFSGILSAISYKNYIPDEGYLKTNVPFDGSEYFGIPTYHNYNIGTTNKEVDQIISYNPTEIMESAIVPYMDDDFIPQGITNTFEDDKNVYANPMVYTSLYNKTIDGITGNKKSIIVEMDPNNSYNVQRCFQLNGELDYNHNGGIAFFNKRIYVSSAGYIETYSLPDYTENSNKYITLERSYIANVSSVASYMTYYNDTVWVGDFVTSGDAFIKGYPLNEDGSVNTSLTPREYKVLTKTQGVAWTNIDGNDILMISVSYGDSFSKIFRVPRTELSSTEAPSPDKLFTLPAGGEDLTFDNDKNLISQSESGAKYFQKRASPWDTFFPFIYKISHEKLFGDLVSIEKENQQLPAKFNLYNNYPNPFNPSTVIRYEIKDTRFVSLKVFNSIGQEVAILVNEKQIAGRYDIEFNSRDLTSGIYFYQIIANGFIQTKKMLLLK